VYEIYFEKSVKNFRKSVSTDKNSYNRITEIQESDQSEQTQKQSEKNQIYSFQDILEKRFKECCMEKSFKECCTQVIQSAINTKASKTTKNKAKAEEAEED